jgi:homoserine O-acetyltransferase/O-succinyltransferase
MEKTDHTYHYRQTFALETGEYLPGFQLRYTTWGRLNSNRSNVIWICHALTGSSDFTSWWSDLFSDGSPYAPEQHFIICVNALGGCYGSTGPLSINPLTSAQFFHDFPQLTNRDVVRAFDELRKKLGFEKIHTLIGGSLGGQQALEWCIEQPDVFEYLIAIACNAFHSPWGIAFNEAQRMAIEADPTWKQQEERAGIEGLKAARAIAMLSYRHYNGYTNRQAENSTDGIDHYRAASYQRYQGDKLARRFNAFTYYTLGKMMDSHHIGRSRHSVEQVLARIKCRTLVIGIDSDLLFPLAEQEFLARHIPGAELRVITSDYGHDGFLVEFGQLKNFIHQFYEQTFIRKAI